MDQHGFNFSFHAFVAIAYLDHQPKMMAGFATPGNPSDFPRLLGVFKILEVVALLSPGFPLLKEWAYAGFTFTFIGAFASHLAVNQNQKALLPLIALILLAVSCFTRSGRLETTMIAGKSAKSAA